MTLSPRCGGSSKSSNRKRKRQSTGDSRRFTVQNQSPPKPSRFPDSVLDCRLSTVDCRLLFVYGTLRRGFAHHKLLRRLRACYAGEATVQARLLDLGDFPGTLPSQDSRKRVVGELYRLPNPTRALVVLDHFEGYRPEEPASGLFLRAVTSAKCANSETEQAWIYWLNRRPARARLIPSGDYARKR